MTGYSLNSRLIVEAYKTDKSLRANVSNGFATIAQKTSLKGLTVLMDARLPDGRIIRAGSKAYIREELLHSQQWAQKPLECDTLPVPFLVVEMTYVEFVSEEPTEPAA